MLHFGRRRFEMPTPFSGRYLTRLLIMGCCCVCALVALNWRRLFQVPTAARGRGANARLDQQLETAIAPSPFGEMGLGVIVADGQPRTAHAKNTDKSNELSAVDSSKESLPEVDRTLLDNVLDKVKQPPAHAYYHLVTIAAQAPAHLLGREARRDVSFANLWNDPDTYRGELIYLNGYLRGLHKFEATTNRRFNPTGLNFLYQGDLFTEESRHLPYVIVVPSIADGMPLGTDQSENVTFAGYFLQLWRYTAAGNVERAAPLLIGRILVWQPAPRSESPFRLSVYLAAGSVLLMVCAIGLLWAISRRQPRTIHAEGPGDERTEAAAIAGLAELERLDAADLVRVQEPEVQQGGQDQGTMRGI